LKKKKEEKTVEIPMASQAHMRFSKTCTLPVLWKMADLDPFTETSCSEDRKKGSMKLVAPNRLER
jgi:hypothetical protein